MEITKKVIRAELKIICNDIDDAEIKRDENLSLYGYRSAEYEVCAEECYVLRDKFFALKTFEKRLFGIEERLQYELELLNNDIDSFLVSEGN